MYMRTTTLDTNRSMLNYISARESEYNSLSEEASSGVKVSKPSDDPSATRSILNINTQLSQLQTYIDNMTSSKQELTTLDDTLSNTYDLVQKANDLAIQAANGTYSNDNLDAIKEQVDSIIESVVSYANTDFNGTYIFSGTRTSTEPYTIEKDDDGNITSIMYNGTPSDGDYKRTTTVGDGVTNAINVTGDAVFGQYDSTDETNSSGLLNSLMTLSSALGSHDQAAISDCLTDMDTSLDTLTSTQTKFAIVANKFDLTTKAYKTTITSLKENKSDMQDADLAEVLTQLAAAKTALEATYSVTSNLLGKTSLLDYL